jgi:RNA polymerase sigma-70 factor (ECF subfamily)
VKEILAMCETLVHRTITTLALGCVGLIALACLGARQAVAADDPSDAETASPSIPAPPAKPVLVLKYGDNKADGKKSIAGAGEMIRFTMPAGQANPLKALRIHCARYGYPQPPDEDVQIEILNEDMTDVVHTELVPYRLFKRQAEARWQMIPLEDSIEVPAVFWVVLNFNAEATKGVYVSYDTSTGGEHSRVGLNDLDAKETEFKGDWMVQAVLEK